MIENKKSFGGKDLVNAGRVRRAFGIRGQLTVDWNNGSSPVPVGNGNIYLNRSNNGSLEEFIIIKDHDHGDCNIITLKELGSRTVAEEFRGSQIWVERESLPELKEGEYYSYQLIDMRVETVHGEYLGEIKEIFSTGSNDVYVVRDGSREILIPAIEDVVIDVDLEKRLMKIELIEGLK